jgi:hypothetical protein
MQQKKTLCRAQLALGTVDRRAAVMRTLLRLWCEITALMYLLWRRRGVGKSSTVAMYGATKLYAILAMRVRCTSPPQLTCPPATQAPSTLSPW